MSSNKTALVFATDEAFAALAKGLVLSVRQCNISFADLYMIDIGCSNATLEWMKTLDVQVVKFDRRQHLPAVMNSSIKPYQDAQLLRPFLPTIVEGYDVYIWCDADIWIQKASSVGLLRDIIEQSAKAVPMSPLVDASYSFHYKDGMEFMNYARQWFSACYGSVVADTFYTKAVLNSGFFGMHRTNLIWDQWASEVARLYAGEFENHFYSHLAEQTALSYLVYSHNALVPIEAIHNYNCHAGRVARKNGKVVIDCLPERELGVIHLTYSSKLIGEYIEKGLLYESGNYLTEIERNELHKIQHY